MKQEKAAVVYARTLLESAEAQRVQDQIGAEVRMLAETFRDLPALHKFLINPIRSAENKAKLLEAAAAKLSPLMRKFLKLLETKNRLALLRAITAEYIALEDAKKHILRAVVVSAAPLAKEQLALLTKSLEAKKPGKKFIVTNQVDASLIAGFRIQQGDSITDASIKHQLEKLKQKLAA